MECLPSVLMQFVWQPHGCKSAPVKEKAFEMCETRTWQLEVGPDF